MAVNVAKVEGLNASLKTALERSENSISAWLENTLDHEELITLANISTFRKPVPFEAIKNEDSDTKEAVLIRRISKLV